jgi:heat shock protein HtpX
MLRKSKLNFTILLTSALVFGVLAGLMGIILLYMGFTGETGIIVWIFISFFFIFIQWLIGPWLIKRMTGAKEIKEEEAPEIHQMLKEISEFAGIPKPKLYFVNRSEPNAFAFGRTQGSSGVALHKGLIEILTKEELRAVIAHEVGHIKHRDVSIMTIASSLPTILYYMVIIFGSGNRRNNSILQIIMVFIGGMVAQFIGVLLVMWLSRTREYYADEFSAYATKNPLALITGLSKITYKITPVKNQRDNSFKTLYISDPSKGEGDEIMEIAKAINSEDAEKVEEMIEMEKYKYRKKEWMMTHPVTAKRLERLWKIKKGLL